MFPKIRITCRNGQTKSSKIKIKFEYKGYYWKLDFNDRQLKSFFLIWRSSFLILRMFFNKRNIVIIADFAKKKTCNFYGKRNFSCKYLQTWPNRLKMFANKIFEIDTVLLTFALFIFKYRYIYFS